jgi:hypothetical protein
MVEDESEHTTLSNRSPDGRQLAAPLSLSIRLKESFVEGLSFEVVYGVRRSEDEVIRFEASTQPSRITLLAQPHANETPRITVLG